MFFPASPKLLLLSPGMFCMSRTSTTALLILKASLSKETVAIELLIALIIGSLGLPDRAMQVHRILTRMKVKIISKKRRKCNQLFYPTRILITNIYAFTNVCKFNNEIICFTLYIVFKYNNCYYQESNHSFHHSE